MVRRASHIASRRDCQQRCIVVESSFSVEGHNVLVTGGTRGIGRAISLRFARAGARVLAAYVRDIDAADRLAPDAATERLAIRVCRADVTTEEGVDSLLAESSRFDGGGRLSSLVHCAATGVHRPMSELTLRHFDWTFALNV